MHDYIAQCESGRLLVVNQLHNSAHGSADKLSNAQKSLHQLRVTLTIYSRRLLAALEFGESDLVLSAGLSCEPAMANYSMRL